MNKGDLVDAVAAATGESKSTVGSVVDATLDAITGALKGGDKVTFTGFGTFERRYSAARTGRNPQTGEAVSIAAGHRPAFKAGKGLKDAVK
ncbi:MAG TPA: HU family DNA-binding protein [Acidimicrobiia bacterium]|jgi:DNA-binding protein HU-beta